MDFLPMKELLSDAVANGYAVASICVWNAEIMQTVLDVAQRMKSPVILMNGPSEFELLDPLVMARTARAVAQSYTVPAALHLDHGESMDQVRGCLDAGYTSVMLDYSTRSFEENVAALKGVCAMAGKQGVSVEGEIGAVGRVKSSDAEGSPESTLTDPDEAVRYAEQTGVDALAVSIGNAHGHYKALPHLDFPLLGRIYDRVKLPLVLHGGSGTPDDAIRRAISLGIAKINVASDLIRAMRESLVAQWNSGRNLWAPTAQAEAMRCLEPVVEAWIRRVGSMGRS